VSARDAVELAAMLPDPLAEIAYRRQLCREAFERGRAIGDREGYERARAEQAADWHAVADPASRRGEPFAIYEERRWGPRGRGHFGDPGPGDLTPAQMIERARASWEPFGLPEPGTVHLGGQKVHRHGPCLPVCYSYRPGWYPAEQADAILAAVHEAIADRDQAGRRGLRAAA
jgi:hypothetical protein